MSDHDRGAYTPHQDAPLHFDARGSRGKQPMPLALIGSAAVLAVLIGAVTMYYAKGGKADGAPTPVGESLGALKRPAQASAQPTDPAPALQVVTAQNVPVDPKAATTFAPEPETPRARPAPGTAVTTPPVATLAAATPAAEPPKAGLKLQTIETGVPSNTPPKALAKTQLAAAANTDPSAPLEAPAKPVVAKVATAKVAAAKPVIAKPVVAKAAPKTVEPKATLAKSTPATGVVVQIGAFSSAALADKGYGDISHAMGGQMSGRSKHVEPVAKGEHTLYRTSVGGFASRDTAKAFCDGLKAKGKICFVKG